MADPTFEEVPKGLKVPTKAEKAARRGADKALPQRAPDPQTSTGTGSASKLGKIRRDDLDHARS